MPEDELALPEPPEQPLEILGFPAETDPPLSDRPRVRPSRRISDRVDLEAKVRRAPMSASAVSTMISEASGSGAVTRTLGREFVSIGGHQADAKGGRDSVVVFYSYTHQWTVEVRRAARETEWSTRVLRTQPPLTEDEIATVVEVAREAVDADTTELQAGAMSIMREEADDPLAGRRLADVRFFPADRRLPLYFAIVDVADRKAVESGLVEGHHHG